MRSVLATMIALAAVVFLGAVGTANANLLTYDYSGPAPGHSPPNGIPPWLVAQFAWAPGTNTMSLTITGAPGLVNGEYGDLLAFTDSDPNLTIAAFNASSKMNSITLSGPGNTTTVINNPGLTPIPLNYTANNVGLDGGGLGQYALRFIVGTNTVPTTASLKVGVTDSYVITKTNGNFTSVNPFGDPNVPQGFYTAAQIVDINPPVGGSNITYIYATPTSTVPEPTGLISLAGLSGVGLAGLVWRRRRAAA